MPPPKILFFREGLGGASCSMMGVAAGEGTSSGGWAGGMVVGSGVGEGVLRLDFMGCVWRGLLRLVVTLSQCHGPAWELINRYPQPIHRQFLRTMARS